MTPGQLNHLRLIDAHLTKLIEIAEKRTPGWWVAGTLTEYHMVYDAEMARHIARLSGLGLAEENAAFIASCAGNAEAGWRSTKAAVRTLKQIDGYELNIDETTSVLIDSILSAWPRELLTLP
jgi:hypothetical protein